MAYTSSEMKLANAAWLLVGVLSCATVGSTPPQGGPPPPQDMDPARALGLWQSNFGAVKIEANAALGGMQAGAVHGVWQYNRQGQDVVGYFFGTLRGNVLSFRWQEPGSPPLGGEGFIVFDQAGRQYSGRWWSSARDRLGLWNGWRQPVQPYAPNPTPAPEPQPPAAAQPQPYPPPQPQQPPYPPQPSNRAPQYPGSQPPSATPPPNAQVPQVPYPPPRPPNPGPQQPPTYF